MTSIEEARDAYSNHMIYGNPAWRKIVGNLLDPLASIQNPTPRDVLDAVRAAHSVMVGEGRN